MSLQAKVALVAMVYALLAVLIILLADKIIPIDPNSYIEDYTKTVGVGLTVLTAIAAAILPPIFAGPQEKQKQVTTATIESYKQLFAAANSYYRTLAKLETEVWSPADYRESEAQMQLAEGALLFATQEASDTWMTFWQAARSAAENAKKSPSGKQRDVWIGVAKGLAEQLRAFSALARLAVAA